MAALLGDMPLMLATGPGSELRRRLRSIVVGGLYVIEFDDLDAGGKLRFNAFGLDCGLDGVVVSASARLCFGSSTSRRRCRDGCSISPFEHFPPKWMRHFFRRLSPIVS